MSTTNTIVSTKPSAAGEAIKTSLTLDWEGMSEDDLRALAQQALVVKLQGSWRKNEIPTDATVRVADHKVGVRAPRGPASINIAAMSADEKRALLAKLQASL